LRSLKTLKRADGILQVGVNLSFNLGLNGVPHQQQAEGSQACGHEDHRKQELGA
jgi:hypothetical protein